MRRILNAVATMGASSALVVMLSAVRAKVVAFELGAQGIGVLGILLTAAALAATALGCGLSTSGIRAVAESNATGKESPASVEVALIRGSLLLGVLAGLITGIVWQRVGANLLPVQVADFSIWLGLAVVATVALGGYAALINGRGQVTRLAACNAGGAVGATLVMVPLMLTSERMGLISAVVAPPSMTLLLTWLVTERIPRRAGGAGQWRLQFVSLARLGIPVSASLLLVTVSQFGSRIWIARELDIATAGFFQACWSIAGAYLGFLLGALAAEYYPRMAALRGDREALNESALKQLSFVMMFGIPIIAWMMALAPWVLQVLYAEEFVQAADLLRIQLLGDAFRLVGWTCAFILLANRSSVAFFVGEATWVVTFIVFVILGAEYGLVVIGIGYLVAYLLYSLTTLLLCRSVTGFKLQGTVMLLVIGSFGATGAVYLLAASAGQKVSIAACGAALLLSVLAGAHLRRLARVRAE